MDNLNVEGKYSAGLWNDRFKTRVVLYCFRIGWKAWLGGTQSGPLEG